MTKRAAGIMFGAPHAGGKILFVRRAQGTAHAGEWSLPAGHVEPGETDEQAAVRECGEELGSCPPGKRHPMPGHDDGKTAFAPFFQHVAKQFEPKLDREHDAHMWADATSPPAPLHPGMHTLLQHARMHHGAKPVPALAKRFDEAKHPRASHGRFSDTGHAPSIQGSPAAPAREPTRSLASSSKVWQVGSRTMGVPVSYIADPKQDTRQLVYNAQMQRNPAQPRYQLVGDRGVIHGVAPLEHQAGTFLEHKLTPQVPKDLGVEGWNGLMHHFGGIIKTLRTPMLDDITQNGVQVRTHKMNGPQWTTWNLPEGTTRGDLVRAHSHAMKLALHDHGAVDYHFKMDDHLKAAMTPLVPAIRYMRRRIKDALFVGGKAMGVSIKPFRDEFGVQFKDKRRDVRPGGTGEIRRRTRPNEALIKLAPSIDYLMGTAEILEKAWLPFGRTVLNPVPVGQDVPVPSDSQLGQSEVRRLRLLKSRRPAALAKGAPLPGVLPAQPGVSRFKRYRAAIATHEAAGLHAQKPLTYAQKRQRMLAAKTFARDRVSHSMLTQPGQPGSIANTGLSARVDAMHAEMKPAAQRTPGMAAQRIPGMAPMLKSADVLIEIDAMLRKFWDPAKPVEPVLLKRATSAQRAKVKLTMHEFKNGKLRSGSKKGPKVGSRRQAIAIALSQAGLGRK